MLLVESQPRRRASLQRALRTVGLPVVAVPSVAHVERWPAGEIVATEAGRFTPFWKEVGASHVFVLADSEEEGLACCARGATMWLPRTCRPQLLVSAVQAVSIGHTAFVTDRAPSPVAESLPVGGGEGDASAASRLELIVRHGAVRRFEMLRSKSVGLPVVVRWDRRNPDPRPDAAPAAHEPRRSERRQSSPYTWEVADFVVVERAADVPQMEE